MWIVKSEMYGLCVKYVKIFYISLLIYKLRTAVAAGLLISYEIRLRRKCDAYLAIYGIYGILLVPKKKENCFHSWQ